MTQHKQEAQENVAQALLSYVIPVYCNIIQHKKLIFLIFPKVNKFHILIIIIKKPARRQVSFES
ncbi:hypothetical protein PROVRETT_08921 [Providencia rettgeri DSM 1131]|nr:hypothetical protein PROVRETT_08921 [Providencia rettgeri DSM 1131]